MFVFLECLIIYINYGAKKLPVFETCRFLVSLVNTTDQNEQSNAGRRKEREGEGEERKKAYKINISAAQLHQSETGT